LTSVVLICPMIPSASYLVCPWVGLPFCRGEALACSFQFSAYFMAMSLSLMTNRFPAFLDVGFESSVTPGCNPPMMDKGRLLLAREMMDREVSNRAQAKSDPVRPGSGRFGSPGNADRKPLETSRRDSRGLQGRPPHRDSCAHRSRGPIDQRIVDCRMENYSPSFSSRVLRPSGPIHLKTPSIHRS
jgi:hypothetical protein